MRRFPCFVVLLALGACDDGAASGEACVYHSDCPAAQICAGGRCLPECREARDCMGGAACVDGACVAGDAAPPDGARPGDAAADGAPPADAGADAAADAAPGPDAAPRPAGRGDITGQIHFRLFDDTLLPVARPIVYWTFPADRPAPLTRGATCDCGYPPTAITGEVDGSFSLRNIPAGPIWLVVQKGSFRRIRQVEVQAGVQRALPLEVTELPVRHDPDGGDEIPRLVVGTGRFDAIEDIFAKLRLGPITPTFGFDYHAWMADPGAYGVELMLYQQPRELDRGDGQPPLAAPSFLELLSTPEVLNTYDFVFAPCASWHDYATLLTSAAVRAGLSRYINLGGKLYVTDFAYDLIEQTFPAYIDFAAPDGRDGNADGHVGDPAYMSTAAYSTLMYSSENRALDPDLAAWLIELGASPDGDVLTTGNWVNLNGVGTVDQCCVEGRPVPVTPEVVMSGPNGHDPFIGDFGPTHPSWEAAEAAGANRPHTLRFDYGCGGVMYSTYHTVDHQVRQAGLAAQELVLLYLILEVNECNLHPIKE